MYIFTNIRTRKIAYLFRCCNRRTGILLQAFKSGTQMLSHHNVNETGRERSRFCSIAITQNR